MYIYVVIRESMKFETSVELYQSYNHAFMEAKKIMLFEIDRVYGKANLDELGVKFQDYPKLLYDNESIVIQCMCIEIIKKEVN